MTTLRAPTTPQPLPESQQRAAVAPHEYAHRDDPAAAADTSVRPRSGSAADDADTPPVVPGTDAAEAGPSHADRDRSRAPHLAAAVAGGGADAPPSFPKPLSLDLLKKHARIVGDEDDAILDLYLRAAIDYAQVFCRRCWVGARALPLPSAVTLAVLMLASDSYEHREAQSEITLTPNDAVDTMLWQWRDMDESSIDAYAPFAPVFLSDPRIDTLHFWGSRAAMVRW